MTKAVIFWRFKCKAKNKMKRFCVFQNFYVTVYDICIYISGIKIMRLQILCRCTWETKTKIELKKQSILTVKKWNEMKHSITHCAWEKNVKWFDDVSLTLENRKINLNYSLFVCNIKYDFIVRNKWDLLPYKWILIPVPNMILLH